MSRAAPYTDAHPSAVRRFREAYRARQAPRIAVLLNRQLSDEVREWVTDSRLVLAESRVKTKEGNGAEVKRTTEKGGVSGYSQRHSPAEGRDSPNERWMWAFEDGFIQPFLDSGAKLVDRATILRLTAARSGRQGAAYDPISAKKVEMDSLEEYADVFVEILISRSPSSLYGYEFKASAKEVKTGIIVANVTSLRWRAEDRMQRRVVATSTGYESIDTVRIPSVAEVASDLGVDLMNAMSRAWGE